MKALAVLAVVLALAIVIVPTSSATVLRATINTATNIATVNASSDYRLFYTYPNNSEQSHMLNGTTIWLNATASLNSSGIFSLQNDMREHANNNGGDNLPFDNTNNSTNTSQIPQAHIVNATIFYQVHVHANETNLTIYRNLTLELEITNITKKVGNRTIVDMSWRAFKVQGELMSTFNGILQVSSHNGSFRHDVRENMDVNILGDLSLGEGNNFFDLSKILGNSQEMNKDTIDFNVFSVPLSQWQSHYSPAANVTYLYYNESNNMMYSSTENINGNNYTLKIVQDPSATLAVTGKAQPISGNELAVVSSPSQSTSWEGYLVVGVVAIVLISILAALLVRRRN
ncbi:MAG: hypothetical protein ACP5UO_03900 [Thermoplasmata archaeon]